MQGVNGFQIGTAALQQRRDNVVEIGPLGCDLECRDERLAGRLLDASWLKSKADVAWN